MAGTREGKTKLNAELEKLTIAGNFPCFLPLFPSSSLSCTSLSAFTAIPPCSCAAFFASSFSSGCSSVKEGGRYAV